MTKLLEHREDLKMSKDGRGRGRGARMGEGGVGRGSKDGRGRTDNLRFNRKRLVG
jgi:hypothetical protein